jgi:hypothetical protein
MTTTIEEVLISIMLGLRRPDQKLEYGSEYARWVLPTVGGTHRPVVLREQQQSAVHMRLSCI